MATDNNRNYTLDEAKLMAERFRRLNPNSIIFHEKPEMIKVAEDLVSALTECGSLQVQLDEANARIAAFGGDAQ